MAAVDPPTSFPLLEGVPGDIITRFVHDGKGWEPHIQRLIACVVPKGAIVVDVGANIGVHTVALADAVGSTGIVYAVEPNPDVLPYLTINTAAKSGVVKIVAAIAGKEDKCSGGKMDRAPPHNIGATMVDVSDNTGTIPQVRLDTLLAHTAEGSVAFVKVDVQGFELDVLLGATHTLAVHRPLLLVEVEEAYLRRCGTSSAAVLELLLRANYTLYRIRCMDPRLTFFADHLCVPTSRVHERDWAALTGYQCDVLSASLTVHCEFGPAVQHAYTSCIITAGSETRPSLVPADPPPLLAVHVVTYNEEELLPLFVQFYRTRFQGRVQIYVHDNESNDGTVSSAKALGCDVRVLSTGGLFNEIELTRRRCESWAADGSHSTWVLVVDADEFCDISPDLLERDCSDADVLVGRGWNMVCSRAGGWPTTVATGRPDNYYSKPVLFRRDAVTVSGFAPGSHTATWTPESVRVRHAAYNIYHYHLFSPVHAFKRRMVRKIRRSPAMPSSYDAQGQSVSTVENLAQEIIVEEACSQTIPDAEKLFKVATTPRFTADWTVYTREVLDSITSGSLTLPETGDVLEVGCSEGRTTLSLAVTFGEDVTIICIDPWKDGKYSPYIDVDLSGQYGRFLANTCGVRHRLRLNRGTSAAVLPSLSKLGTKLRFAFIDGDHTADAVYRDATNTWPMLVQGACILFNGYLWNNNDESLPANQRPKNGIDAWLADHSILGDVVVVAIGYQVLVRKVTP